MPFAPTQQAIDIAGIKDGIIITSGGGYRIVLSVSTVNFALKSEDEQNSIIFQYQSFLNSLHFPIQIIMRSRKLDLTPYLNKVGKLLEKQENELTRIQTEDYIDFVGKLINLANIMKKTFYVAVPFDPVSMQSVSFIDRVFKQKKDIGILRISEDDFKRNSEELKQRASVVANGLGGIGLRCIQLGTEELIELFYQIYNPEVAGKERITDANELSNSLVKDEHEKPKGEKTTEEKREEAVIDNSAAVQAAQEQAVQQKQREEAKAAEKVIKAPEPAAAEKGSEKTTEGQPGATTKSDQPAAPAQQAPTIAQLTPSAAQQAPNVTTQPATPATSPAPSASDQTTTQPRQ